jgi:hypothetical protein
MTAPTFSFLALLIAGLLLASDLYGGDVARMALKAPSPAPATAMLTTR